MYSKKIKTLLMGDSISLYYRNYLFLLTKGVVDFNPNLLELEYINSQKTSINGDAKNNGFNPMKYLLFVARRLSEKASKSPSLVSINYDIDRSEQLNCEDSARMLEKLKIYKQHNFFEADLILINCGLHDIKRDRRNNALQIEPSLYRNNLLEIIDLVGAKRLCWITTTPVRDGLHEKVAFDRLESDHELYNTIAVEVMSAAEIPIIDLCTLTQNIAGEVYRDHVHFNIEAAKIQAAFIAGCLFSKYEIFDRS